MCMCVLHVQVGDIQHFYFREGDAPPFNKPDASQNDTDTGKRNRKGEPVIIEGYMDKPKGMAQIAWERGLYRPDSAEGKMHGKAYNEDDTSGPDRSFSLVYVLSSCWDFAHEKTALEELVESRGHILRMCVKGHPE